MLLKVLFEIKGKFILSSYPSDILKKYSKEFGWKYSAVEQKVSVNSKSGYFKAKTEMITCNF